MCVHMHDNLEKAGNNTHALQWLLTSIGLHSTKDQIGIPVFLSEWPSAWQQLTQLKKMNIDAAMIWLHTPNLTRILVKIEHCVTQRWNNTILPSSLCGHNLDSRRQ